VVNATVLREGASYANSTGLSSVYDFNLDGLTDVLDKAVITGNMSLDCNASGP
jgi:hypothetical protein